MIRSDDCPSDEDERQQREQPSETSNPFCDRLHLGQILMLIEHDTSKLNVDVRKYEPCGLHLCDDDLSEFVEVHRHRPILGNESAAFVTVVEAKATEWRLIIDSQVVEDLVASMAEDAGEQEIA